MRLEQQTNAIERDRARIECSAKRRTLGTFAQAKRHANAAVLIGHDPEAAARNALDGLATAMTETLTFARLSGLRRTQLTCERATGERVSFGGINLSREDDERRKREREWRAFLLLMLGLDENDAQRITASVRPLAVKAAQQMTAPLAEELHKVRSGLPTGFQVDLKPGTILKTPAMSDVWLYVGVAANNPYLVDRWVETSVVNEYERGRWDGTRHPAVANSLWGYRYSAIRDNRTSRLCRTLDGWIAPKDEPAWRTFTPPNHFHCRSCLIEVWQSSALRTPTRKDPAATPDDWAEFRSMKAKFQSYL